MKVFRTTVGVAGELDIPRVARDQLMPGSEILIVVGDANFEGARERESRGDPVGEERDPKQQWFWSDEWQAGEREVDEQIARGEVTRLEDAGELMAFLDRHRET